jgi:hypothetical protein
MTLKPQLAADGPRRDAADRSRAAVNADTFVINLCSSTTPMALVHPDAPELKRFTFFVSRRLEDGRERFRLHMGYFETLEEAEDWLSVVRDIYPGAWAGETPGKRLRSRVAAPAQSVPPAAPEAKIRAHEEPAHDIALAPPPPAPPLAAHLDAVTPAPVLTAQRPPAPAIESPRDVAASAPAGSARAAPRAPLSNVREVLAALDERDAKRVMPTSTAPRAASDTAQAPQSLSDTQVMQILEARRPEKPAARGNVDEAPRGIPMLRPDDSGTRRALKEAVLDNAAVSFAVQLQWSGQPMALDRVPPLAIFSAYTLYTVEGSRGGRTWYGLRLGFFGDAIAARQVAQYVRSDFASVAVVPVSPQERGRAASADHITSAASPAEIPSAMHPEEIKLLDEGSLAAPRIPVTSMGDAAKPGDGLAKTGSPAARAAAMRSKKLRGEGRTAERKGPYSLEETLEILGAGNLEIDNGRGELINESGVRHTHVEVRKNSPFARLVARLTERMRKS